MPRVALVFPYFRTRAGTELLFAPLGVATLAGQLRKLGIETKVFDCTFSTFERLQGELESFAPDIVGISSMVSLTRNTMRIAEMVRETLPQSLLVAGGPMPSVFPRRFARQFDVVFRGEADLSFPRFCRDYFDRGASAQTMSRLPLEDYCGLFVPNHGLSVDNPTTHHGEDELESFPLPDRSDFDHTAYQDEWFQKTGTKVASIIVTLGCPFGCDFCSKPIFGNVVRRRSLDAVFAEIEQLRALGYDGLWIADDTFTLNGPLPRGVLPAHDRPGHDLDLPRASGRHQRECGAPDEEGGLPAGLPGARVRQPGHAQAHEQAGHGRGRRAHGPPLPRGGHRDGRLLHRRLPRRDRGVDRGDLQAVR